MCGRRKRSSSEEGDWTWKVEHTDVTHDSILTAQEVGFGDHFLFRTQ